MTTRILLTIFLLAGLCWPAQHSGTVRSGDQPIPGATVTASSGDRKFVTTTDESGKYNLPNLNAGTWTVEVEMFGFAPARREVPVGDAESRAEWALELKAYRPAPVRARTPQQRPVQNLTVNETASAEEARPEVPPPTPDPAANANEAFLVNGSLSGGLNTGAFEQAGDFEQRRAEFMQTRGFGPGMGGPGFGGGPGGADDAGGGPGAGGPGMRGPGVGGPGGPGGPGGGPGMRGAGGPGMPGGPGGGPGIRGPGGSGGGFGARGASGGGGRGGGGSADGGGGSRGGSSRAGSRGRTETSTSFGNRRNRGQQSIRGGASLSLRNSALDARPYSLTGQTLEKPSYAQNRFNFTLGGPLRIPKLLSTESTFFFINYSGSRSRGPFNQVATLPSPLERAGDFSQSITLAPVSIFDPANRAPFPGNRVPESRFNSASLGLLEFIPLPNLPGRVQNYHFVTSSAQNSNNFSLRLNQNITRKDRIDSTFTWQSRDAEQPRLFGFRDGTDGSGMQLGLTYTRNLARRSVNTLRGNFSRNRSNTVPFFAFKRNIAAELGIGGTATDPINWGPPNLSFTNFGALNDGSPVLRRDQTASLGDSMTLTKQKHNLSFGSEFRRIQLNSRTDQNARGTFSFSGLQTSAFDANGQPLAASGFDMADFLLGLPQSSSVRFGTANTYFRASVINFYGNDDWRLRSNLSINFGLRYEYFTPYHEKFNHIANLDVAPGFTGVAVVTPGKSGPYSGEFPAALMDPDGNNLSPRIGFAWRPIPKSRLQIRGGYGIFHNGSIYNQFPSRLASQPPFANTASLTTSLARQLTLQNGFSALPSTTITNTYAVDRAYRIGYAQTWNFSVQHEVAPSVAVELGYLGTKGTRLDIQRLPNRAAPGSPLTAEQRRLIGNAVGFTFDSSEGNSIYHAGQVRVTRRFRRGISANALYTFAKSIDNASTLGGGGATVAQNDADLRAERGLSSFNRRHTFNAFYTLVSPVGPRGTLLKAGGPAAALLQDWTLSGGFTAQAGQPLTARVLGNLANSGGTGSVGSGRADATGASIDAGGPFFNLAAFTIPPSGRFGNAGRNTIIGPPLFSMNLGLSRSFRLGEDRRQMEFRVEGSNLTNHVGITNLSTVVNASNYGLPVAAQAMRTFNANLRFRF